MNLQTLIANTLSFINDAVIPALFAIASLAFFFNVTRYFIIQGGTDKGREDARRYILWSLIGFVVIFSLWGIVNLFSSIFDQGLNSGITPDYMCEKRGDPYCETYGRFINEAGGPDNANPLNEPVNNGFDFMDSLDPMNDGGGELVS